MLQRISLQHLLQVHDFRENSLPVSIINFYIIIIHQFFSPALSMQECIFFYKLSTAVFFIFKKQDLHKQD